MVTKRGLHSDLAIPPGEYLVEVIEELGITQAEVARRMGRPIQAINEIALGKKAITSETALQLEKVTGVPAHIWTGLENEYRLVLARNEDEERLRVDATQVDPETFRAMSKLGWVPASRRANEKARELCRFFGVASLAYVKDAKLAGYAFRIANRDAASSLALAAWLRKAELDSHAVTAQPFNANQLRLTLAELRALTRMPPSKWLPAAKELLAASGVVLVVLPHLPKTYANGATFWLSAEKAVSVLSPTGYLGGHLLVHPVPRVGACHFAWPQDSAHFTRQG